MDFIKNLEKKMQEKNLNKSQLARGMGVAPSLIRLFIRKLLPITSTILDETTQVWKYF